MTTARVVPLGQPVEPELYSANNEPAAVLEPLFKLLENGRAQASQSLLLNRANQTIRAYDKPTLKQVLDSLAAVESMAYSFFEQGTCGGDIESGFECLRADLNKPRGIVSREKTLQDAKASWYGDDPA